MVGSVRNSSSKPEFEPFVTVGLVPVSEFAQSDFNETVLVGRAEFGINPSCKHLRHHDSKSAGAADGEGAPASCGRFAGILPASTRSLPRAVPYHSRQYSLTMS